MGTRGVIYTRVSSDPNDRGRSVAEQETECRAVCQRNDWQVVAVFSDNDRSATAPTLPCFEMLKTCLMVA